MLNKITINKKEFNFEELLEEMEEEGKKGIVFEFTACDKKDAIETIKTMGKIINVLMGKLDAYEDYTKELVEDNKRLYEENNDYFTDLIEIKKDIKDAVCKMSANVLDIANTFLNEYDFTKDEENEEDEEEW